jgi:hypothetical protein
VSASGIEDDEEQQGVARSLARSLARSFMLSLFPPQIPPSRSSLAGAFFFSFFPPHTLPILSSRVRLVSSNYSFLYTHCRFNELHLLRTIVLPFILTRLHASSTYLILFLAFFPPVLAIPSACGGAGDRIARVVAQLPQRDTAADGLRHRCPQPPRWQIYIHRRGVRLRVWKGGKIKILCFQC